MNTELIVIIIILTILGYLINGTGFIKNFYGRTRYYLRFLYLPIIGAFFMCLLLSAICVNLIVSKEVYDKYYEKIRFWVFKI